jgi:hypothetical protein
LNIEHSTPNIEGGNLPLGNKNKLAGSETGAPGGMRRTFNIQLSTPNIEVGNTERGGRAGENRRGLKFKIADFKKPVNFDSHRRDACATNEKRRRPGTNPSRPHLKLNASPDTPSARRTSAPRRTATQIEPQTWL